MLTYHVFKVELVVVFVHPNRHEALVEVASELIVFLLPKIQLSAKT